MTLPLPEPLEIPDPNIDDPALPATEPLDDPDEAPLTPGTVPGGEPSIGDPPAQVPPAQA